MQRLKQITTDGSHTLYHPQFNATYHSVYGAVQESRHVFLEAGLLYYLEQHPTTTQLHILETGWGTGLNTLLTLLETEKQLPEIHYDAVEPFPLKEEEWTGLNYCTVLQCAGREPVFRRMHEAVWNKPAPLSPRFILQKHNTTIQEFWFSLPYHLVYFDAFAPAVQPELWTVEIFKTLCQQMIPGAVLVTYCSKGEVRRNMEAAGFMIQKIPGPPHKREMIRAVKR